MTQVYERVNVTKIISDLKVNEKALFGHSFNMISMRQVMYQVKRRKDVDLKLVEVPEGFMIWRKA